MQTGKNISRAEGKQQVQVQTECMSINLLFLLACISAFFRLYYEFKKCSSTCLHILNFFFGELCFFLSYCEFHFVFL